MSSLSMLSISSGSSGNCTYIGDDQSGVLIDCGESSKKIIAVLAEVLPNAEIEAVFITHEHGDHIRSAAILERKLMDLYGRQVPFFMSKGTFMGTLERHPEYLPQHVQYVSDGDCINVGEYSVEAIWIPHDVVEPLAYRVSLGQTRAAVVTDLGHCPMSVINKLRGCSLLAFEFNYDPVMLMESRYPQYTKNRVYGPFGHLSNEQAGEALTRIASPLLEHVVLAHISKNTNTPQHALKAAQEALAVHSWGNEIQIHIGQHHQALPLFTASSFEATPISA